MSRQSDHRNDWGASEVHDWGVPPPPGTVEEVPDDWDVVYDLSKWGHQERKALTEQLSDEGVEFEWEGFQLRVPPEFEEVVDELVGLDENSDSEEKVRPTLLNHLGGIIGNVLEVAVDVIASAIPF